MLFQGFAELAAAVTACHKVQRFADKDRHQIFVEPEGLTTHEVYPNGISTSLAYEVQEDFVNSIKGFENAKIIRPGYAIEYDFFDPRGLKQTLEVKRSQEKNILFKKKEAVESIQKNISLLDSKKNQTKDWVN